MKEGRVNFDALVMQAWASAMGMWAWQCGHGPEHTYAPQPHLEPILSV